MLEKGVAVVEVNFLHRRLRHEVQHVGTRPAETDNGDAAQLQLRRDQGDIRPAGGVVDVVEYRLLFVRHDDGEGCRLYARIEDLRRAAQDSDVGRDLVIVVIVVALRLRHGRKHEALRHATADRLVRLRMPNSLDRISLMVAGIVPIEVGDVVVGLAGDVVGQHELGDERAAPHHLARGHIGHPLHQQIA